MLIITYQRIALMARAYLLYRFRRNRGIIMDGARRPIAELRPFGTIEEANRVIRNRRSSWKM